MGKRALRAVGVSLVIAALALARGPRDRLAAAWTPLALSAHASGGEGPRTLRLHVPAAGRYAIGLVADRPATLKLGPFAIARHPGGGLLVARSIELAAGDYPVLAETSAPVAAQLYWQPPGQPLVPVPAANLSGGTGGVTVERDARPPLAAGELALPLVHPLDAIAPVITHWRHADLGVPTFPPLYALSLTGELSGPAGTTLEVAAAGALSGHAGDGSVRATLEAGAAGTSAGRAGDASAGAVLKPGGPGPWAIELELLATGGDDESLVVRPLEGARLAPPGGGRRWVPFALTLVGVALLVAGGRLDAAGGRNLAVAALLALALVLRLDHYTVVPHPLETEDELIHHWNGYSLVTGGGSVGWSDWPAYGVREPTWFWGHRLHVVRPFLDWPPPMCLLTGLVDRATGPHDPRDLPLHVTRLVPIALSLVAVWLTYRLAREVAGGSAGPLLATAVVATLPLAVGTARLVKSEALLAPLALALSWCVVRRGPGVALCALAAAVVAVKPTGLALAAVAVVALAAAGERSGAGLAAAGVALGLASYPAWGCLWDKSLYAAVQGQLAGAQLHPENLLALVSGGSLVDRDFGGGFMLALWLALLAPAAPAARPVKLAAIAYASLVALTTWFPFGWYRIPLYPLLAVLAGPALARFAARPRADVAFLLVATALVPALAYRLPLSGPAARPLYLAVVAAALAVPAAAALVRVPRAVSAAAGAALVAALLGLAAAVSLHLPWIDRGLVKDRQPAFEELGGRTVRWR